MVAAHPDLLFAVAFSSRSVVALPASVKTTLLMSSLDLAQQLSRNPSSRGTPRFSGVIGFSTPPLKQSQTVEKWEGVKESQLLFDWSKCSPRSSRPPRSRRSNTLSRQPPYYQPGWSSAVEMGSALQNRVHQT